MNEIVIRSPAKINLSLSILDKRNDGYHNLKTHFQLVDIYDHLKFKSDIKGKIRIKSTEIYLNDEDNTIYNAAKKLLDYRNSNDGIEIEVKKNIPLGSGLGGASSNAASTLIALNKLWSLNLNKENLMEIASSIGADAVSYTHLTLPTNC